MINDIGIWALSLAVIGLVINLKMQKNELNKIYQDFYDKIKDIEQKINWEKYTDNQNAFQIGSLKCELRKQKEIIAELCNYVYKDN